MFCFSWDNKQTKSKRFVLVPIISRPNQNILLQFWKQADQIKMFCFRSNNKGTQSKPFASISKFFYYIGTFHFASDNFWTKSNWFASSQNLWAKTVTNCFWYKKIWTKPKSSASVPILGGPNQNVLLSFR